MKTFDPTPLWDYLPSFYKDFLSGEDQALISKLWEGYIRLADSEWARAVSTSNIKDLTTVPVTSFYPLLYEALDNWQSTSRKHQHYVARQSWTLEYSTGNFASPGVIYLGAYVEHGHLDVFVDGSKIDFRDAATGNRITDVQDALQVAGDAPAGTRLIFQALDGTPTTDPTGNSRVIVVARRTREVATLVDGATSHRFTWEGSPNSVDADTIRITVGGTQIYPNPYTVTGTNISFVSPIPIGVPIRIEDDEGVIPLNTGTSVATRTFDVGRTLVNPKVFLYGLNLDGFTTTDTQISWTRPLATLGRTATISATYQADHDHGRHEETLAAAGTITLPTTRPLALDAALNEISRFPVMVYESGTLLYPGVDYEIASTVSITSVGGGTLPAGSYSVVYTDQETALQHKHEHVKLRLGASETASSVDLLGASTIPVDLWISGGYQDSSAVTVQTPELVKFATQTAVLVEVGYARYIRDFTHALPDKTDEEYRGRLVSAASLADGIDSAANTVTDFEIVDGVLSSDVKITPGWFSSAHVDEGLLHSVYGSVLGLDERDSDQRYKDVITAVWLGLLGGSSLQNIDNFANIVLGSDYIKTDIPVSASLGLDSTNPTITVKDAAGATEQVPLSLDVPIRDFTVEKYQAVSQFCEVFDAQIEALVLWQDIRNWDDSAFWTEVIGRVSEQVPWIAYFAEDISDDYAYAKRLDKFERTERTAVPDSFDRTTSILADSGADFIDFEVRPGDLARVVISGTVVFTRVKRVVSATELEFEDVAIIPGTTAWGEGAFSDGTWGGLPPTNLTVSSYTLYSRRTRTLDSGYYLDQMLSEDLALSDGENVRAVNAAILNLIASTFFFIKIAWGGPKTTQAVDDTAYFLREAKPADSGFFLYTEVPVEELVETATLAATEVAVNVTTPVAYITVGNTAVNWASVSP